MKRQSPKTPRPRDVVWDALVAEFGEPTNDAERGRMNRACKLLKQSKATPETITRCMHVYRCHRNWRDLSRTPTGLASNITELERLATATPSGRIAPNAGEYDD